MRDSWKIALVSATNENGKVDRKKLLDSLTISESDPVAMLLMAYADNVEVSNELKSAGARIAESIEDELNEHGERIETAIKEVLKESQTLQTKSEQTVRVATDLMDKTLSANQSLSETAASLEKSVYALNLRNSAVLMIAGMAIGGLLCLVIQNLFG
jgi:methyl-accepting chemotaxis protein